MSRDKVRPLSENRPNRPFSLNAKLNDKDNVQRVPPPPQTVFIPHPQLAPPGMAGTRREFKPLVRTHDKGRTRDR
jgi:hypothetical protein